MNELAKRKTDSAIMPSDQVLPILSNAIQQLNMGNSEFTVEYSNEVPLTEPKRFIVSAGPSVFFGYERGSSIARHTLTVTAKKPEYCR